MAGTLPKPLAGDGVVTHDPVTRSLLVKAKTGDPVWPLWRQGHQALLDGNRSGRYSGVPTVYASGAGRRDAAAGEAVGDGWLRFKIHDDAAYRELANALDLSAIVTVDKQAGRILAVRFRQS